MIYRYLFELFTQHIPEAIALSFTATVFLKAKLNIKLVFIIGLVHGTVIHILRNSPLTFGYHTVISLLLMTLMLKFFFEKNSLESFISVLKTIIILTITELFFISIIIRYTFIDSEIIQTDPLIRSLSTLPQTLLLMLIGIIIYNLYKINEE